MRLAIISATTHPDRSLAVRSEWWMRAGLPVDSYLVINGCGAGPEGWQRIGASRDTGSVNHYYHAEILGVVPAFAIGVQAALEDGADVVACLHDDCEIYESGWGDQVLRWFDEHPKCGLLGFGGGRGLGAADIYQTPYHPMQLARQDFVSNMRDAEAHGRRVLVPTRVAALDGFSQIGRREFWLSQDDWRQRRGPENNLFALMEAWGCVHHFYDGMLGCFAAKAIPPWEVWMLPIACHHQGGVTAVGDARYQAWAQQHALATVHLGQHRVATEATGDQAFWVRAHEIGYSKFRGVLPIRVEE